MLNRSTLQKALAAWVLAFALLALVAGSPWPLLLVAEGTLCLAATHEGRRGW
jgi:hypothetical protein